MQKAENEKPEVDFWTFYCNEKNIGYLKYKINFM